MSSKRIENGSLPENTSRKPERARRRLSPEKSAFGIVVPALPKSDIPIVSPDLKSFPNPLDYPWAATEHRLQEQASAIGEQAGGIELPVVEAPSNVDADFAIACHKLAKPLRKAPGVIASELAAQYNTNPSIPYVVKAEATQSGYLNFELDIQPFGNAVLHSIEHAKEQYGQENIGEGKTVMTDASSPNVAKYMSVGHLRSTVIGESLARIYKAGGYQVIRDNHLGDWGTQFGMLGRAKELWGKEIDQELPTADPVQKLYRLYVKMHEEIEQQKAANNGDSTLEQEGREWFKRLENSDPEALALLHETTGQSIQEFRRVYDLLGSKYEYFLGESFYVPMIPDLLRTLQQKDIVHPDDRGGLSVDFPEESKLNRLMVQKSDGTSLYSTRDLAALVARTAWFHPDKILYVVGGDQKEYFKQVFATFDKLAQGEGPKPEHVSFGLITLPEGKMSTRRGRVIFLEDVLSESIARARAKITETNRDLSPVEVEKIAQQVGVGAVIYMDLGQSRERNIKFDWDQALSFDGNSAPYIQYAHARGKSILKKAADEHIRPNTKQEAVFTLPIEVDLVKHLSKFSSVIAEAIKTNEPSTIAAYTYKTAELFSKFYRDANILREQDTITRNTRLRLAEATTQVIANGLNLLGIAAPEKM